MSSEMLIVSAKISADLKSRLFGELYRRHQKFTPWLRRQAEAWLEQNGPQSHSHPPVRGHRDDGEK